MNAKLDELKEFIKESKFYPASKKVEEEEKKTSPWVVALIVIGIIEVGS